MDKNNLWILEEIKRAAANEVGEPLSCNFRHQLFILDLTDKHWENVFTQKEPQELEETGDKVLVPVDNAIEEKLNELNEFYLLWGFLNDILTGSNIVAQGKEKTSKASATQFNNKRKLSAIDEVKRKAIGRRMDCIYIDGSKELWCMEVGSVADQTKELKDSREQVSMLDMDSPKGYVSQIRHTVSIDYPSCSEDYVARIGSLIELASIVKKKIPSKYIKQLEFHWKLPNMALLHYFRTHFHHLHHLHQRLSQQQRQNQAQKMDHYHHTHPNDPNIINNFFYLL
ncbi:hypothetical protein INT45_004385 [Circinella minor]|uniref:Uncharacterized protein n=1 Tax=Circinella minor TaxID=1195481 RepID=A0A8H7VL27_9FUNG|nr:hypothetical protein INT45_004385 [Circinella minor]